MHACLMAGLSYLQGATTVVRHNAVFAYDKLLEVVVRTEFMRESLSGLYQRINACLYTLRAIGTLSFVQVTGHLWKSGDPAVSTSSTDKSEEARDKDKKSGEEQALLDAVRAVYASIHKDHILEALSSVSSIDEELCASCLNTEVKSKLSRLRRHLAIKCLSKGYLRSAERLLINSRSLTASDQSMAEERSRNAYVLAALKIHHADLEYALVYNNSARVGAREANGTNHNLYHLITRQRADIHRLRGESFDELACLSLVPVDLQSSEDELPPTVGHIDKLSMAIEGEYQAMLHFATLKGDQALARFLIDEGADLEVRNRDGETPLHLAAKRGHRHVAKLLLGHKASVDVQDNKGNSPLHIAVKYNNLSISGLLLDWGSDLNAKDNSGLTPLHIASTYGHVRCARLLLEKNADKEIVTAVGQTALHIAVYNSQNTVASLLIRRGAKVNVLGGEPSQMPLHLAATYSRRSTVEILLKSFADPNALSFPVGETPLYRALSGFNNTHEAFEVVHILLKYGAHPNIRNIFGDSPISKAERLLISEKRRAKTHDAIEANKRMSEMVQALRAASARLSGPATQESREPKVTNQFGLVKAAHQQIPTKKA